MQRWSIGYAFLAVVVVFGMTVSAAAVSTVGVPTSSEETAGSVAAAVPSESNNSSVDVTVGQQLSTVIGVSSDEIQTDVENTAFELSVEGAGEEARAEAIADRAEELRERAEAIREDYVEATEAYESGEITKSDYAQQLATLNARATNLLESYEQLQERTRTVSALELRAAGVNQSALRAAVTNLSSVSGAGAAALLQQFTGASEGEIELETADGLKIEIESEDGEQSREIERPRDDDSAITVNQSVALETARGALSTPENGSWTLTESKIVQDDGSYEFAFALRGDSNRTGSAEIRIDGSSGEVFRLEEEIEPRDDEDDEDEQDAEDEEDEEDDGDGELALIVSEGTPVPNESVTIRVLSNGRPAGNVTVRLNDRPAGTTGSDGTVTVTLPPDGEAEITARKGEAEGELEFEFAEGDEVEEVFRRLDVTASLTDDTVSVTVTYNGSRVSNATMYANDEKAGTTDSRGTTAFSIDTNETDELELEIVKGEFEAELEYRIQNGSLTLIEEAHEGDGDEVEDDADEGDSEDDEGDTEADESEATETQSDEEEEPETETETGDEEPEETETEDDEQEQTETETAES